MQQKRVQIIGLILTTVYAAAIIWLYATEPRSFREVATGAQVAAGTYQVDQEKFNAALALFRREQFRAARDEWQRADPAQKDPTTQFYIAYSFYREGWGRVYNDQNLFKQGLEAVNRALMSRAIERGELIQALAAQDEASRDAAEGAVADADTPDVGDLCITGDGDLIYLAGSTHGIQTMDGDGGTVTLMLLL